MEVLTLRQNMLKEVTLVTKLSTLRELDLYDNELSEIPDISELTQLT